MPLTDEEYREIRAVVHQELDEIERQVPFAGSYDYLCEVGGVPTFTHERVGSVLRYMPHLHPQEP